MCSLIDPVHAGYTPTLHDPAENGWMSVWNRAKTSAFICQRQKPLDVQRKMPDKTSLHTRRPFNRIHSWCSDIIGTETRKRRQKQTNSYLIAKMLISGFCLWKGTSGWLAWALCRINKLCVPARLCFCAGFHSEGPHLNRKVSLAGRQRRHSDLCKFTLMWVSERRQASMCSSFNRWQKRQEWAVAGKHVSQFGTCER